MVKVQNTAYTPLPYRLLKIHTGQFYPKAYKNYVNQALTTVLLVSLTTLSVQTQIRVNDAGRVVERNVEYRANSKVDQGINKGQDTVEEGVMGIFKKKNKMQPAQPDSQPTNPDAATN